MIKMKFGASSCINLVPRYKSDKFFRNVLKRYASTGVNLFSEQLSPSVMMKIEEYWKDKIHINKYDESDTKKQKFYALSMFPYPSGKLHMGHVRVYTISDSTAHYYRMKGFNVLHPIGWDAFGLPAENAAIERQVDPAEWTETNIKEMKNQLLMLNYNFDWDREISTCDPEYYKWTQDLFLKLYEQNLVYQSESYVNWDPVDETVLAEEQVSENNISWRSGAKVEKKLLKQWYIRTTGFSKELVDNLKNLDYNNNWRDIPKIQANWIGQCNGITFDLQLISNIPNYPKTLNVWTKLPEFIEYAKFIAISPDSVMNQPNYCTEVAPNIQKLDARVINPFNGKELPVYITNEVTFPEFRDNYLGIPATNMDDYVFLEKVGLTFERHNLKLEEQRIAKREEVLRKAKEWKIGGYYVSSRSKDWLISRQRYWGTPIPLIHCKSCGVQPVPRSELPVLLPNIEFNASKKVPTLDNAKEWLNTKCPKCGNPATREADTMDTFVDSSWYYLRFIDPKNKKEMFSKDKVNRVYPTDLYIGGKEHGTLHLYYARFISYFLHSQGLLQSPEPFTQLLTQGMVKGKTYKVKKSGKYLKFEDVVERDGKYFEKDTGAEIIVEWKKMSKSKHNGVDPLDLLNTYGIDTTRMLILGDVSPLADRKWSLDTLKGIQNLQNRIWNMVKEFLKFRNSMTLEELQKPPTDPKFTKHNDYLFDCRNFFLKTVSFNISGSQNFNTAISRLQGFTNSMYKVSSDCIAKSLQFERALATEIIILAPVAPHFSSEMWSGFCSAKLHLISQDEVDLNKNVLEQKWPEIDKEYKMLLRVFVNNGNVLQLPLTKGQLDALTPNSALQLLQSNPEFMKQWTIDTESVKLNLESEADGVLHVKGQFHKQEQISS